MSESCQTGDEGRDCDEWIFSCEGPRATKTWIIYPALLPFLLSLLFWIQSSPHSFPSSFIVDEMAASALGLHFAKRALCMYLLLMALDEMGGSTNDSGRRKLHDTNGSTDRPSHSTPLQERYFILTVWLLLSIATTAPKFLAAPQRAMSTEVVRNIDDIKDITVTPNNSAGKLNHLVVEYKVTIPRFLSM